MKATPPSENTVDGCGGNTAVGFTVEVHDPHARSFTVCQLALVPCTSLSLLL